MNVCHFVADYTLWVRYAVIVRHSWCDGLDRFGYVGVGGRYV